MTNLDPAKKYVTLINTFTVDPTRAEDLLELLKRATKDTMRHMTGFVSANLHIALDRSYVANYAHWESKEAFEAMLRNPDAQLHMRDAAEIAESYMPVLYELQYVDTA